MGTSRLALLYGSLLCALWLSKPPSASGAELRTGLTLGSQHLFPSSLSSLRGSLRGGVAWETGLELGGLIESAKYPHNISYLSARAELLWNWHSSHRRWGLGLTGGLGQYGAASEWGPGTPGKRALCWGTVGRMELRHFQLGAQPFKWGGELVALLQKPGDKTLVALSPAIWIETRF